MRMTPGWPKFETIVKHCFCQRSSLRRHTCFQLHNPFADRSKLAATCMILQPHIILHWLPPIPISFVHLQGFRSLFLRHLRQIHGLVELSAPNASNHGAQVGELKGLKGILRTTLQQHRREMGWTSMVRLGTCQAPAGSWGFMDAEESWKNPVKKTSER